MIFNFKFCTIGLTRGCDGDAEKCRKLTNSGFEEYVGMPALTDIESNYYCNCTEKNYGPNCDKKLQEFIFENKDNCNHGTFDARNTITGCSCRESQDGNATEYHGWYCERPNQ